MDELEQRRRAAMAQAIVDDARERLARLYGVDGGQRVPALVDLLALIEEDAAHG